MNVFAVQFEDETKHRNDTGTYLVRHAIECVLLNRCFVKMCVDSTNKHMLEWILKILIKLFLVLYFSEIEILTYAALQCACVRVFSNDHLNRISLHMFHTGTFYRPYESLKWYETIDSLNLFNAIASNMKFLLLLCFFIEPLVVNDDPQISQTCCFYVE